MSNSNGGGGNIFPVIIPSAGSGYKEKKDKDADDDDDDDDEEDDEKMRKLRQLDDKTLKRAFKSGKVDICTDNNNNNNNNNDTANKRPVFTIGDEYKKFKRDPVAALIEKTNPMESPEEIMRFNDRTGFVDRLIDHNNMKDRIKNEEWKNKYINFLRIVSVNVRSSKKDTKDLITTSFLNAGISHPEDIFVSGSANDAEIGGGAASAAAGPKFKLENATEQDKRDFVMARTLDDAINSAAVQGRVEMSDEIYSACVFAVSSLNAFNPRKFTSKTTYKQFIMDDMVMFHFSKLVSRCAAINQIITPSMYYANKQIDNRNREALESLQILSDRTVYNAAADKYCMNDNYVDKGTSFNEPFRMPALKLGSMSGSGRMAMGMRHR
jgi:hypothetical protein